MRSNKLSDCIRNHLNNEDFPVEIPDFSNDSNQLIFTDKFILLDTFIAY